MNKVDVQQAGGFPLETDTLNAMQSAYEIFNALGAMTAPLGIIKGCVVTGSNVGDGVVHINNEVLEFRGGAASANVIIKEDVLTRNFENGETKTVYRTRYATFGHTSTGANYPWANFHRSLTNKEIAQRCNHVGFIQDYYGSLNNIPTGWVLCDGQNGTPDLRGLFIVGYDSRKQDYNEVGKRGGLESVVLTTNQMPRHNHPGTTNSAGEHTHSGFQLDGSNADNGDPGRFVNTANTQSNGRQSIGGQTNSAGGHSHTVTTNDVGNNEAHENRPPFYVLAKIMYKG